MTIHPARDEEYLDAWRFNAVHHGAGVWLLVAKAVLTMI